MSDLDSLEGSALGVPLDSFFQASCLRFNYQIPWGSPLLLPVFLLFVSEVFGGISEMIWGTWEFFLRDLILRIRINFLGGLPIISGLPRSFVPCYQLFSKYLGWTARLLQEMYLEVFSLPSVVIISWRRRYRGVFFLAIHRAYFDVRISSYSLSKDRLI